MILLDYVVSHGTLGGISLFDDLFSGPRTLVDSCLPGAYNLSVQKVGYLIKIVGSWRNGPLMSRVPVDIEGKQKNIGFPLSPVSLLALV